MPSFLLNPKNILMIVLGICIIALGVWISLLRIDLNMKKAKIVEQESQITELSRANEILNNNARAAREAETQMKILVARATDLRDLVDNIPEEVKKGLQNESMERINHCVGAYFTNGMLPKDCNSAVTVLSKPASTSVEGRSN